MSDSRNWYAFKALSETEAELSIYDEIGGWGINAGTFIAELKQHAGRALTVRINSPGGSITEGSAIFNALRRHKGGVTVQIDGLAASMASYIALAGAPVRMAQNAYVMIHNPSGGVRGGAEDMRRYADTLDKMKNSLAVAYSAKTGKDIETISDAMDAETWFTAEEAKNFGLVDEITDALEAVAKFDLSGFRNAPRVDTREPDMAADIVPAEKLVEDLTVQLNAARSQAQKNFSELTEARMQVDTLTAELGKVGKALGELRAEYQAYKDGEEKRLADATTNAVTKLGLPEPVAAPAAPALAPAKPDLSGLKGINKVRAVFETKAKSGK